MKKLLLFLLLFFSVEAKAHNVYFAFSEGDWNNSTERFEVSLCIETHDFEHYLTLKGFNESSMEKLLHDTLSYAKIVGILKKGFYFNINGVIADLNCDGYEILKNGKVYFYFSAGNVCEPETIEMTFNTLMDKFKSQQNKFTYLNHAKQSLTFSSKKTKAKLEILQE